MFKDLMTQMGSGSEQPISEADPSELGAIAHAQNLKKEQALGERLEEIQTNFKSHASTTHSFARVVPEDCHDMQKDNGPLGKYCLVALWKFVNDQYCAYRMFKVENPAFLEVKFHEH